MIIQEELALTGNTCSEYVTLYQNPKVPCRAFLLYFHGGGLLYGTRGDLPELHRQRLADAGFRIAAFDYPLAPAAKLPFLIGDAAAAVNSFLDDCTDLREKNVPFFLWGRSAGAYLCLLLAAGNLLEKRPVGILSYYGYGFLTDGWFLAPNPWYCKLPPVFPSCLDAAKKEIATSAELSSAYNLYVYARQSGKWISLLYEGREKYFYLDYTLRACESLPCPLFCAHSTGDPDVPFQEFTALASRYHAQRFIASENTHDFDRDETAAVTARLLDETILFLEKCLSRCTLS